MREHPLKKGKPQIVLVDHGLYKTLDGDFQEAYARLWKGIVMANIPDIKSACEQLGVHKMVSTLSVIRQQFIHLSYGIILFLCLPVSSPVSNVDFEAI